LRYEKNDIEKCVKIVVLLLYICGQIDLELRHKKKKTMFVRKFLGHYPRNLKKDILEKIVEQEINSI
jgi:hypothetical protein